MKCRDSGGGPAKCRASGGGPREEQGLRWWSGEEQGPQVVVRRSNGVKRWSGGGPAVVEEKQGSKSSLSFSLRLRSLFQEKWETCTKPHGCRDSVVIPVDGTETLIIDKKRKGWRGLHYVARVIQVADYKRLVHAIKFGLALVLVSLLYMLEAVHDKLGDNAMWAVMTVVVVFEYTAGATATKGLNRLVGTIIGGGLGSLVAIIAQEIGGVGKAVIIGISIFIFGAAATYLRTIANIKKKYDYGVLIFILTLSLVSISGVRVDEIIQVASARLSSICMGFGICALVSLFIFPVWAGDELHSSLASKFNSIAHSIEDCMNGKKVMGEARKPSNCLSVLSSKSIDESLANFAKWEPWHGRFGFYYPWNKYLQIAGQLRELAACIISAEGYLKAKQEA
ncbi:hypothetical protein IEQ34_012547 [Dendrobium chrysotoxum]|uniref:Aluminum-activated malate transporter n=1 Tax=Dendrobium chrysotoxum TaxID=161865 RepID=A0AAV7GVN2_DENCH|nr:hypothetical protein IEQ34_012547 [Dendrobium chrysotoxum]